MNQDKQTPDAREQRKGKKGSTNTIADEQEVEALTAELESFSGDREKAEGLRKRILRLLLAMA